MQVVGAETVHSLLEYRSLIESLRAGFSSPVRMPPRQHLEIDSAENPGSLLLMPCWEAGAYLAVKVVSVFPQNPKNNLPTVIGTVLLFDGSTGKPLAAMDGSAITVRRTSAASALAADYLALPGASTLLMVGAGALAPHLIRAHATIRRLRRIWIWNRTAEKARELARDLATERLPVAAVQNVEEYARQADIISCATSSAQPLIRGQWVHSGAHLDLVGAYTPAMCEVDSGAVVRSRVFVDTRSGALSEAGDLIQPLRQGLWSEGSIQGDLHDLVTGQAARESQEEITLFKSVGVALEDLVAARQVFESLP